jgi:hypothetical protein
MAKLEAEPEQRQHGQRQQQDCAGFVPGLPALLEDAEQPAALGLPVEPVGILARHGAAPPGSISRKGSASGMQWSALPRKPEAASRRDGRADRRLAAKASRPSRPQPNVWQTQISRRAARTEPRATASAWSAPAAARAGRRAAPAPSTARSSRSRTGTDSHRPAEARKRRWAGCARGSRVRPAGSRHRQHRDGDTISFTPSSSPNSRPSGSISRSTPRLPISAQSKL